MFLALETSWCKFHDGAVELSRRLTDVAYLRLLLCKLCGVQSQGFKGSLIDSSTKRSDGDGRIPSPKTMLPPALGRNEFHSIALIARHHRTFPRESLNCLCSPDRARSAHWCCIGRDRGSDHLRSLTSVPSGLPKGLKPRAVKQDI